MKQNGLIKILAALLIFILISCSSEVDSKIQLGIYPPIGLGRHEVYFSADSSFASVSAPVGFTIMHVASGDTLYPYELEKSRSFVDGPWFYVEGGVNRTSKTVKISVNANDTGVERSFVLCVWGDAYEYIKVYQEADSKD